MKLIPFLILLLLLVFLSCSKKKAKVVKAPHGYDTQLDLTYKKVELWKGRIDLYTNPKAKYPTPIVLNIHGGGWHSGKKENHSNFDLFFKNGYAVANVEYRLVTTATAPSAIEDVRCALIYLHNNAKSLNIDRNKIILKGDSAGAHLALMAGFLGNDKTFDNGCDFQGELNIAAIINKYGITDLLAVKDWKPAKNWLGEGFTDNKFIKSVSPLYLVSKNSPPVFIAHGNKDEIVPYSQSTRLYNALKELGVKTDFLTIPGAGHGRFTKAQNTLFDNGVSAFLKTLNLNQSNNISL